MNQRVRATVASLVLIAIGAVLPFVVWLGQASVELRSTLGMLTFVTQAAGITGLGLFAVNLFLSGRYRWFDWVFGGLDRLYRVHRRIGEVAFALLALHVGAASVRAMLISNTALFSLWLDPLNRPLGPARIAFVLLLGIVFVTLLRLLSYERRKQLHRALGVVLFLGGLHALAIPSDVASNPVLRTYLVSLVVLALLSWAIRSLFGRWLVARAPYVVEAVHPLSAAITEVVLRPFGKPIAFTPGQFAFFRFRDAGVPDEEHPFSITAAPDEGVLRLSAKKLGDFTEQLPALKVGARAEMQGPFGGFWPLAHGGQALWLAGGIGITPFLSAARALAGGTYANAGSIRLIHSVKSDDDLVFDAELSAYSIPGFAYERWDARARGVLTDEALAGMLTRETTDVFLCGPPGMVRELTATCRRLGVPASRIHSEIFALL